MPSLLFPAGWTRLHDVALLLFRLALGAFLIWGVWDNIVSPARMAEFQKFLTALHCPMPQVAAPLSVWAQFLIGVLLIPGVLTRWAGVLLAGNFVVAVALLAPSGAGIRDLYSPAILIFVGLLLATGGAGRLSVDHRLETRA